MDHKPDGWPTIVPRLITPDPDGLIAFMTDVFGAVDRSTFGPAELWIGDSIVMVSDGGGLRDPTAAMLYVYVADTDACFARAVAAGAVVIEEPEMQVYGDRRATVRDAWGNIWQIATKAR